MKQSLIVFGDIHGDFDALVYLLTNVLKVATFEKEQWRWVAKNLVLVCLGDFLDRFRVENEYTVSSKEAIIAETKIISCFIKLQEQATEKLNNCEVVILLGNHEVANLLQFEDYFMYGMRNPENAIEQSQRAVFLREKFVSFAETCPVAVRWGNYFMCHGGFELSWLQRHKFESIEDINKRFLRALRDRKMANVLKFMEPDSILVSRKMALHTSVWRDFDKNGIAFQIGEYIENPKFIVGHSTTFDIQKSALGEYTTPKCDQNSQQSSILASQNYDGTYDAYFLDVAMSRGFWPKDASRQVLYKHRPQAMLFQIEVNDLGQILFTTCATL